MRNLLIQERPLIVLPSLVKEFDGNYTKAIVLQQIHFLSTLPKSGVDHDGHHWVWFTYEEFVDEYMPWLSVRSIRRTVTELEEDGYIVSTSRIRDSWDSTKYYRVAYDRQGGHVDASVNGHVDASTNGHLLYTETSSENTSMDELTAAITAQLQTHMPFGVTPQLVEQHRAIATQYGLDAWKAGFEATPQRAKHNANYVLKATLSNLPEVEPVKKATPATITIYGDDGEVLEVVEM